MLTPEPIEVHREGAFFFATYTILLTGSIELSKDILQNPQN